MQRKAEPYAAGSKDAVRKLLELEGWREQEDNSLCINNDKSIVITWWNRGADARLVVDQDGIGTMLFRPLTSKAAFIRSLARRKESMPNAKNK